MDPDPASSFIIIGISLLASAFFSGMEIAFVSANRLQIELDSKQSWRGRLLAHLASKPQQFIATMLVGNNLALVFCGLESGGLISEWLFHVSDWPQAQYPILALAVQTGITTVHPCLGGVHTQGTFPCKSELLAALVCRAFDHTALHHGHTRGICRVAQSPGDSTGWKETCDRPHLWSTNGRH